MPNYKVTFFFESEQAATLGTGASLGWTETWYRQVNGTLPEVLDDPQLQQYLQLRTAFMPDIYRCSFIRLSEDDKPRRFKIESVPNGNGQLRHVSGFSPNNAAQVQCCVLVDLERMPLAGLEDEPAHHRRFLIRGLPQSLIDGNVLNFLSIHFPLLESFLDFIGGHAAGRPVVVGRPRFLWGIRYHDPVTAKLVINTIGVGPDNDRTVRVTFVPGPPDPPVPLPRRFEITGVDSPERFNRTWNLLTTGVVGGLPFYIGGNARKKLQGGYIGPGPGKGRFVRMLYGPVDQYAIIGLRNKKTGRPFRPLRGRSARR